VIAGEHAHAAVVRALGLLGLGRNRVRRSRPTINGGCAPLPDQEPWHRPVHEHLELQQRCAGRAGGLRGYV